jgi:hypothetical protein
MLLHGCIIMGVHELSAGRATLIVLIFPMFIVGLAVIALFALILLIGAEFTGDALPGLFEFGAWLQGDRFAGESKERDRLHRRLNGRGRSYICRLAHSRSTLVG